ncbi:M10 family metallopeptidase [Oceanibacterium hippocampi]|uniref:Serralysin n=1 Tax=Oceanibacterium hippocampi TaxID=745714 RepID=A0A1Y5S9L4_9PROT|nr:matrixin family metalloprotease [Oceanibacterium hippocampi]SLN34123.1 Serralysin precursor [Oceanibacterium hippocampi]
MYLTGSAYIDSLLASFQPHWNGEGHFGESVALSYSFARFDVPDAVGGEVNTQMTGAQKTAVRDVLQLWADVAEVTFGEVVDTGSFSGDSVGRGDINFTNGSGGLLSGSVLAYAFFPFGSTPKANELAGDVHVNVNFSENLDDLARNEQGHFTLIHEVGHALGLTHPGEGELPPPPGEANDHYTVMVASTGDVSFGSEGFFPATPMINDIAAIQHLYGANMAHATGDDVYAYGSAAVFETIWDAGGYDFIDCSTATVDCYVSLVPGTTSFVGGPIGSAADSTRHNLGLAYGTLIEAASGGKGDDTLQGGDAAEDVRGLGGADRLLGGDGDDFLRGDGGADSLVGGAGDDTLSGGSGNDTMNGGAGSDRYAISRFDAIDLIIDEGSGGDTDVIAFSSQITEASAVLSRTGNNLVIDVPSTGQQVVVRDQFDGNDRGVEELRFGDGAVMTRAAIDDLFGGMPGLLLNGGDGDDSLTGGAGNDSLIGRRGDDTLTGNGGDDVLDGYRGADVLDGGAGDDFLDASADDDVLIGGTGNDTMNGGSGNDTMTGGDGADSMNGGDGDDTMSGGAGADTLKASSGDDTVDGGSGNDRIDGHNGYDLLFGGNDDDFIEGGRQYDTLNGGSGDDTLYGQRGQDTLNGDDGNDYLHGGSSSDVLDGGAGNDTLDGSSGWDTLVGGAGDDTMTGGTRDDLFILAPGSGDDVITDFTAGADTDDVLDYTAFEIGFADLAIAQVGADTVITATDGGTVTLLGVAAAALDQDDDFLF